MKMENQESCLKETFGSAGAHAALVLPILWGDKMTKTNEKITKIDILPTAGICPRCYKRYMESEKGYYCTECGDMGWWTLDQWHDAHDAYYDANR